MKKVINYLENEINEMESSNALINAAAMSSPFGNSINLEEAAKEHLKKCESRISVEIWQKHRIKVLKSVLEEVRGL